MFLMALRLGMDNGVVLILLWQRLGLAVLGHHIHEPELQRVQTLASDCRNNKDRPAKLLFQIILDKFGQLFGLRHICLIQDDDAGALTQIP